MALSTLSCAAVDGVDGLKVKVEVDVAQGLPGFTIVGLADKSVEESKERVRSALRHSGYKMPLSRLTVHLAPSAIKKSGVHFDLPVALTILVADEQIARNSRWDKTLILGGLALDGSLQPIAGALIMADWAAKHGFERVILPAENFQQASLASGIEVIPASSLEEVIKYLDTGEYQKVDAAKQEMVSHEEDWLQVRGQFQAKRSAVIAASGGHNLLLHGEPGAGKTLLARGIRALLPEMNAEERMEVVKIHGLSSASQTGQVIERPFRNPHHTASPVAIVGGGSPPHPGEISYAHKGLLFFDELPEFPRSILEALRQPLEDGVITVARSEGTVRYPANFLFVATMNPCPCGWNGSEKKECTCTPQQIHKYQKRVSGPIIDRIDIAVKLPSMKFAELRVPNEDREELRELKKKIAKVRLLGLKRAKVLNSKLPPRLIDKYCPLTKEAETLLEKAVDSFSLTGRGIHKVTKVARTIADLDDSPTIDVAHLSEALQYRFES